MLPGGEACAEPACPPLVRFRPFAAEDVLTLTVQQSQRVELGLDRSVKTIEEGHAIAAGGPAWTAIARDGRILACAGFAETFPNVQALAWAVLAEGLGAAHLAITREAIRRVAEARYRRIEMIVACRTKPLLWALRLGFMPGHGLRNFGAASEPAMLFERFNDAAQ